MKGRICGLAFIVLPACSILLGDLDVPAGHGAVEGMDAAPDAPLQPDPAGASEDGGADMAPHLPGPDDALAADGGG